MTDGLPDNRDPTEPRSIPEPVRREAFNAAMVAAQQVLHKWQYPLDAIAELELIDFELEARYQALGGGRED